LLHDSPNNRPPPPRKDSNLLWGPTGWWSYCWATLASGQSGYLSRVLIPISILIV
jgi:hypothetical protein